MYKLSIASKNIVDSIQTITTAISEHSYTLEDISKATDSLTKMAETSSLETEKYKVGNEAYALFALFKIFLIYLPPRKGDNNCKGLTRYEKSQIRA